MTTALQAYTGAYEIDRAHSTVQFSVNHLTVSTFRGSFGDVDAGVTIDDKGLSIEAEARVESISIVDPPAFREHVVSGDDFFAADAHPRITFRSRDVELDDAGRITVVGDLTIRGTTQPVRAAGTFRPPVEDPFGTSHVGLELRATIDRRSWGMNWQLPLPEGGDALGWEVEVSADIELTRAA